MRSPKILVPKRTIVYGRHMTHDHLFTNDAAAAIDAFGNQRGGSLGNSYVTHDGRTVDSTGAFLVGELERLDQTLNMPLAEVSYGRDIQMREDVTVADEASSFTLSTFGASSSTGGAAGIRTGKAWVGKTTGQIAGLSLDLSKAYLPLTPWAMEVKFSILELESAARIGRPIDDQKVEGLKLKHQMDVDEQVYVGDATLNVPGLLNYTTVTNVANVPNGVGGSPLWTNKTPSEILKDLNDLLHSVWQTSAWSVMPSKVGLPPALFGYISTQLISSAGNISILRYLLENNIVKASGKGEISIVPMKWLVGAGVGGTFGTTGTVDRMIAYTNDKKYVRFPMTLLQRTPVQYQSLYHLMTYYAKLGVVEMPYPETVGYRDGL